MTNKLIVLMADYASSGLWTSEDITSHLVELDISNPHYDIPFWLKEDIREWSHRYSMLRQCENFDLEYFDACGYALAVKLKASLPEYTVLYYSELSALSEYWDRDSYFKYIP